MNIEINKYPERAEWKKILMRPSIEKASIEKTVKKIIDNVREKGDKALRKYTRTFDGIRIKKFAVAEKKIKEADEQLPGNLKDSIRQAKQNIETFHRAQQEKELLVKTMPGVTCWRRSVPIETIGIYIPGGSAPLFSTVLMLAAPAQIAGCKKIILCSPPSTEGNIHPAILYTAMICGIGNIFSIGGAQAIAAMAYGTETIPKVDKILGPGNQYVTLAKQIVQKDVAIDMPAGPSEVLIIADDTANPTFVAADLLSQAEHGTDSQVILVSTSEKMASKVMEEINIQFAGLPKKQIIEQTLANSCMIIVHSLQEAIELSNYYAPEHLIINCRDHEHIAKQVTAAGSVFIGEYSPESAGDYASGTNHTLPTNGHARAYSGVSLDTFIKKITFQQLTKEGINNIASTVMTMAEAEGLEAHKNAIAVRINQKDDIKH